MTHARAPDVLSHNDGLAEHGPSIYDPQREQQINTKKFEPPEILDKEELKAAQKLLANDSSMPLGLSALGVSLLTIAGMLGVRIRRGLQQATTSACGGGHEFDMSVALAPTS